MRALMIDADSTRDRDDAFTVSPATDGRWEATVYIANVSDVVPLGSNVDSDAADRGRTIYGTTHRRSMLGQRTEALCSLRVDCEQSVMAVRMSFAADGTRRSSASIERTTVPARTFVALDHHAAVQALGDLSDPLHHDVAHAWQLARALAAQRASAGALVVYDSRRQVMTTEDGRLVAVTSGTAQAHLLVQELMIAANRAVAEWAIDRGLPILFRNHRRSPVAPEASARAGEVQAVLTSPEAVFDFATLAERINLTVTKAVYEPVVDGHYGLQVPAYTHITSPLRRYADLVNQRIVLTVLDGERSPYDDDELQPVIDMIAAAAEQSENAAVTAQKVRAKRSAARAIADDALTILDDKAFTRALKLALSYAPAASVVQELSRRAHAGSLTAGQAGLVFTSDVPAWTPVLGSVLESLQTSMPSAAMSIWSVRAQLMGLPLDELVIEHRQYGPSHEPVFLSRASIGDFFTPWMSAGSKRLAEQSAVWHALLGLTGRTRSADSAEEPPIPEAADPVQGDAVDGEPGPSDRQPVPVHGGVIPERVWSSMLGDTAARREKKRRAARKNPVGWLNSLTEAAGCARPAVDQVVTGPPHAPLFTVSIAVGDVVGSGSGSTVKAGRVAAADDAVVQLFQLADTRAVLEEVTS